MADSDLGVANEAITSEGESACEETAAVSLSFIFSIDSQKNFFN